MTIEISQYIKPEEKTQILLLLNSTLESNQERGLVLCKTAFPKKYHCRKNVIVAQQAAYWRIVLEDAPSQVWIHHLDLSHHFFKNIPFEKVKQFVNGGFDIVAKKLNIVDLPSQLKDYFQHLNTLNVSDNQILELDVSKYKLYRLDASHNQISSLKATEKNDNLKYLSLRGNQLQTIPHEFWKNAQKMHHLDVSENQLEHFSLVFNWIYSVWRYVGRKEAYLTSLHASHNQMRSFEIIHEEIKDNYYSKKKNLPVFYNFKRLLLPHNLLETLPDTFFETEFMQNLQTLDVSHNQFRKLPAKFAILPRLKRLNVSHNQLEELVLPLEPTLETLLATHNFLDILPKNIGNQKKLKKLHLQNNKFSELPLGINDLENLQELRLEHNQLQYLPVGFSKLIRSLEYLGLAYNQFEEIPTEVLELKCLKTLDLSGNPLPQKEIEKIQTTLNQTKITFKNT